jgi:hypothetical protein
MCCSGVIEENRRYCQDTTDVGCILPDNQQPIRIKAWAMRDDHGNSHVVILNKLLRKQDPRRVQLQVPYRFGYAGVLEGPPNDMSAQHNISFAGLTWDGSRQGESRGTFHRTKVYPANTWANGSSVFELSVAQATAVVISFFSSDLVVDSESNGWEDNLVTETI